ncbi:hypothetical protein PC9H_006058 [Pleurotus ostreatus]|uniref:Uncharacterized protein n=1 Tax=Pleurotus ostreatus TaxID=5322 RepID=A0A8H7DSN8_PLEOS|nr:uncharacterized protein PC9H_006058 [Pleurotus ostreatus]KAF7430353.1 hypothetical protein PC9H_006058 [Pleurotus ostreatus]KAJ8701491.1 hypothetical protein PTI98_000261 [Pleurotus ostreatus]
MTSTTDSNVARLTEMVANLAVQVAALSPLAHNANTGAAVPSPAPAAITASPTLPVATAPPVAASPPVVPPSGIGEDPSAADDPQAGALYDPQAGASSNAYRCWYVVIAGLQVGVFRGWTTTAPLVLGIAGSIYNREPTRETAIMAFNVAASLGQVRLVD